MGTDLARTPIYDWHVAEKARMIDFAGWSMPVLYSSIVTEHLATRSAVGLFDISHMGRLAVHGAGADRFLDRLLTRRVTDMQPGQIRYALVANEAGGILDDVLVYRQMSADGPPYELVVNAGNRARIVAWFDAHRQSPAEPGLVSEDLVVRDNTRSTAMIAIQGPRALEVLAPLAADDLAGVRYYRGIMTTVSGVRCLVSRTGYTGEDGAELIVAAGSAEAVWRELFAASRAAGGRAAGLGCRDTLRLEAALPLYGHELSDQIDPWQAGLDFAVDLEERQFIGRDALARARRDGDRPRQVGLALEGKRLPRQGYAILADSVRVGEITSGTFSPTCMQPIAMGYVPAALAEPGKLLAVDIRGHQVPATVVPLPFYRREKRNESESAGTTLQQDP